MSTANQAKLLVFKAIEALFEDQSLSVSDNTALLGSESALGSMQLVELCLALEDHAAELGFDFDWTSETALSRSRSMFRTAGTLAAEFCAQMDSTT